MNDNKEIKITFQELKELLREQKEIVAIDLYIEIKQKSNDNIMNEQIVVKPFSGSNPIEIDESFMTNVALSSKYPKDVIILNKYL